ncbi:hypothetical protein NBRGN_016_00960 [Nocardia brasiliensis NBRC 14402]|uniref:hypothetical protein n=1 Tax=Nocardia brasiliensis TaxID=37326 RepID=UPI00030ECC98|nr:hypothetical protein [Nocardia brasiliensis]ASF12462.1 hypothetical protein CEQ30_39665 [Nocardia brasiliensis]MBF6130514.1 hypothetical protein [Nocardia brasiliensis]GAJ79712.1 hypothetical protein NBRGN_016_00960 [Nocardia brasiliensis NBRC 14402]SUB53441.1 Uncharacterised protein [Nocardia brasiliensis]
MLEFGMLLIMVLAVAGMVVLYLRGRGGFRPTQAEAGTLYVTGVSPRPDAQGEQYVTITGNLTGPSVSGTVVYGRFAWDVNAWPSIGDLIDVVYSPRNPQSWSIAHPGARPSLGS